MLDAGHADGEDANRFAREQFAGAGIEVVGGSPEFTVTHEKSMVVDDAVAFVQSFNWAGEEPGHRVRLRRRDDARARGA